MRASAADDSDTRDPAAMSATPCQVSGASITWSVMPASACLQRVDGSIEEHMPARPAPQFIPIRWRVSAFLFGFGFLAYRQQKSLTIAAERMIPELGFSQMQIGWLEQVFVLGY